MLNITNIEDIIGTQIGLAVKWTINDVLIRNKTYIIQLKADIDGTDTFAYIRISRHKDVSRRYSTSIHWTQLSIRLYSEPLEIDLMTKSVVLGMAAVVLDKKVKSLP